MPCVRFLCIITNLKSVEQGGDNPCVEYLVFGVERGDSGTPHLQGFVQFNSRKTLAQVKAALGTTRVHLEIARGTATEADEYCRKEGGEIFTRATIRLSANERRRQQGCERRDTHQEQCKALIASIKAKKPRLELLESNLHMAKELNLLAELRPPRTKAPKVIYIYSETGIGKTTTTTRYLERHSIRYYVKPSASKWWPSYDNQPVCILEEFTSCFPCTTFLQLCDPVQFQIEIKGGFLQFDSSHLILLTNVCREEQYTNVPDSRRAAFQRRI